MLYFKKKFCHFVVVFIAALVLLSCSNSNNVTIEIQSLEKNQEVALYKITPGKNELIEKTNSGFISKNVRFSYNTLKGDFLKVAINNNVMVDLIVYPDDDIVIINKNKPEILNSEESVRLQEVNIKLASAEEIINDLIAKYDSAGAEEKASIEKEYLESIAEFKKYSSKMVFENLSSLLNVIILFNELPEGVPVYGEVKDLQLRKIVADSLMAHYPEHRHVQLLHEEAYSNIQAYNQRKMIAEADVKVLSLPELKLPDIDGNTISLTELNSKYTFVYFWSVADKLSINQIQKLKNTYDTYNRNQLEFLFVNIDKRIDAWKKIVHFEEMNWINVIDTAFESSIVRQMYNVQSIPANYLINLKEEEIVLKDATPESLSSVLEDLI